MRTICSNHRFNCFIIIISAFLLQCGLNEIQETFRKKPDISYISSALQESMVAGYAAGVTIRTLQGESLPNVAFTAIPQTFPAPFTLLINLDENNGIPFQEKTPGQLLVSGLWQDDSTGVISIFSLRGSIVLENMSMQNIGLIPIQQVDSINSIAIFMHQDINSTSDTVVTTSFTDPSIREKTHWFDNMNNAFDTSLAIKQEVRIIKISHKLQSHDTYAVWGGGQFIGSQNDNVDMTQFALLGPGINMETCTQNPISGFCLVKDLGVKKDGVLPEMGTTLLNFKPFECRGNIFVVAATGTYIASSQTTMTLF